MSSATADGLPFMTSDDPLGTVNEHIQALAEAVPSYIRSDVLASGADAGLVGGGTMGNGVLKTVAWGGSLQTSADWSVDGTSSIFTWDGAYNLLAYVTCCLSFEAVGDAADAGERTVQILQNASTILSSSVRDPSTAGNLQRAVVTACGLLRIEPGDTFRIKVRQFSNGPLSLDAGEVEGGLSLIELGRY